MHLQLGSFLDLLGIKRDVVDTTDLEGLGGACTGCLNSFKSFSQVRLPNKMLYRTSTDRARRFILLIIVADLLHNICKKRSRKNKRSNFLQWYINRRYMDVLRKKLMPAYPVLRAPNCCTALVLKPAFLTFPILSSHSWVARVTLNNLRVLLLHDGHFLRPPSSLEQKRQHSPHAFEQKSGHRLNYLDMMLQHPHNFAINSALHFSARGGEKCRDEYIAKSCRYEQRGPDDLSDAITYVQKQADSAGAKIPGGRSLQKIAMHQKYRDYPGLHQLFPQCSEYCGSSEFWPQ